MPNRRWLTEMNSNCIFRRFFFLRGFIMLHLGIFVLLFCLYIKISSFVFLGDFCVCQYECLYIYMCYLYLFFGFLFFFLFICFVLFRFVFILSDFFPLLLLFLCLPLYMPDSFLVRENKKERGFGGWGCWENPKRIGVRGTTTKIYGIKDYFQ